MASSHCTRTGPVPDPEEQEPEPQLPPSLGLCTRDDFISESRPSTALTGGAATGIPVGEKGVTSTVSIRMSRASPQLQPGWAQRPGPSSLRGAAVPGWPAASASGLRSPGEAPRPRSGRVIFKFQMTVSVAPRPEDSAAERAGRAVGAAGCTWVVGMERSSWRGGAGSGDTHRN